MSQMSIHLSTSVQYAKGIGPKRAKLLNGIGVETIGDLLYYFPRRYLDRSHLSRIGSLQVGETVTVVGKIYSCESRKGRTNRFVVRIGDGSGFLQCIWFRGLSYISGVFQIGDTVAFSGKVTMYRGLQLVHPEYDKISEEGESDSLHTGGIIPLYPSSELLSKIGLDSRGFRRIMHDILNKIDGCITETLSKSVLDSQGLMPLPEALKFIHFPKNADLLSRAKRRLKFEELFFLQLYLLLQRRKRQFNEKGIVFRHVGPQTRKLVESIPFELTDAQKRVLREIREDMRSEQSMNRLLQGDVGSGKTIVALVSMLIAVENGFQASLMAPTEILAEQHFITFHGLLEDLGVCVQLLKGSQKSTEKRKILNALSNGEIDICIGTHALVQEGVSFKNLGFVVIDEQHRFGVMQRATLRQMGFRPDVLVMTATPIPRTLALTFYGDLDVSVIDELPKGRRPVRTVWRRESKRDAIYDFIRSEVKQGRQTYIVYPLVEESEKIDLANATEGCRHLAGDVFPDMKVVLLHGRMKADEKEKIMKDFKAGHIDILVSTTVIEVGVDVPNASVMLIEHAERFGLTQLHQLRGRIGRGSKQSTCILLTQGHLSEDAMKRIQTMEETSDGFKIAEVDLEIRGPGELFGTRQHGIVNFKIADLTTDESILVDARKEASRIVADDFSLENEENRVIKETYFKQYSKRFGLMEIG